MLFINFPFSFPFFLDYRIAQDGEIGEILRQSRSHLDASGGEDP